MAIPYKFVVPKAPKEQRNGPLDKPSISMIVGPPGSGKTTVLANLMMALDDIHGGFDSGLYVTSNNKDPLIDTLGIPVATTPSELEDWMTGVKNSKPKKKHVLILDDLQGSKDFNMMAGRSDFLNFLLSHRHYGESAKRPGKYGTWIIMTAQKYTNSFSPSAKAAVKNLFLFYPSRDPKEVKNYIELGVDKTKMRKALSSLKTRSEHDFLYVNKHNVKGDRFFIGFDDEMKDL